MINIVKKIEDQIVYIIQIFIRLVNREADLLSSVALEESLLNDFVRDDRSKPCYKSIILSSGKRTYQKLLYNH